MITISDLKQYLYCPRIIYWRIVQPVNVAPTFKMKWGKKKHEKEKIKEVRRKINRYGVPEGERFFELSLDDGFLSGKIDMAIHKTDPEEWIPVEFKFTRDKYRLNHIVQLLGYAALLENNYGTTVRKGFLLYPRLGKLEKIDISSKDMKKVYSTVEGVRKIIVNQEFPEGSKNLKRCNECEYLLFCNDRF